MTDKAHAALEQVWSAGGCDPGALRRIELTGADPVLPSIFPIGAVAAASIGAAGLAASELWRLRTGRAQGVSVDLRAAGMAFRSERYITVNGKVGRDEWDDIAGYYRAADGRFVQLHTNLPHHRTAALELFRCASSRAAVENVLSKMTGQQIEDALIGAKLPGGMLRSEAEWLAHPQGQAVDALPLLEIIRIGDAPPLAFGKGDRPLSGIRVLDLTHVIAGPVGARTMAEHGAEVLRIGAPHLPVGGPLIVDTTRGKRPAYCDIRKPGNVDRLRQLARGANVFVQGYRPGSIAGRGFSPEALAELRPGVVAVTMCAFSHAGPWNWRRGFDSVVQTVSGIAAEGGKAAGIDGPKPLPCQALDHATGYLIAFATIAALIRQAQEGGSWHVRLSLAQTGRWLQRMGRVDGLGAHDPSIEDIDDLMLNSEGPFGRVRHIASTAKLSETPAHFALPAAPAGTYPAAWVG